MKIEIERSLVELIPENDKEAESLSSLWKIVVDCAKFNKKLVAVGEYIPGQTDRARFHIED